MNRREANSQRDLSLVLWGCQVWQVRVNIQHRFEAASEGELYSPSDLDEICFDFIQPRQAQSEGETHIGAGSLWIKADSCGLRLQQSGQAIFNGGDSPAKILAAAPTMIGSRLIAVEIDTPGATTRFKFDDERTLTCFPADTRLGVSWVIVPNGHDYSQDRPGSRIGYSTDSC